MRIPKEDEDLTGKVCVCSIGRIGIVGGSKRMCFDGTKIVKKYWVGIGTDGKGMWVSSRPSVLFESIKNYYEALEERL